MQEQWLPSVIARFFDWGVFNSHGHEIYHVTFIIYSVAFVLSLWCVLRVWYRSRWCSKQTIATLACSVLILLSAWMSLGLQSTSAHDQGEVHLIATLVTSASVFFSVGIWKKFQFTLRSLILTVVATCIATGAIAAYLR